MIKSPTPTAHQLRETSGSSWCEWKGQASYYDLVTETRLAPKAAWSYLNPSPGVKLCGDTRSRPPCQFGEDFVIEVLTNFPDYVAAFKCRKYLTKADLETVLIPLIEDKLSRHQDVRLYWEVAPGFVGLEPDAPAWEGRKFGFSHFFGNAALVTDVKWMSRATQFFGFLMPGRWRVFSTAEADKARRWIVGAGG